MARIVRLTEEQMKYIEENTILNGFDTPSEVPEYTMSKVSVSGKMNPEEFADPITTDDKADTMAKSFPWGTGSYYKGTHIPMVQEQEQNTVSDPYNDTDQSGDGVKDKFNHADANELNDGNEDDDLEVIPRSVEMYLDRLIAAANSANLTPKKKINILNKLVDKMNLQGLPPSYKKETSMKIFSK